MPAAAGAARWSQRVLCAVVGLTLGLMCAALAATMSTGIAGMSQVAAVPGISMTVGSGEAAITGDLGATAGATSGMSSTCDTACVSELMTTCVLAAFAIIATLMMLFLASRRDTFMGLRARAGPTDFAPRPRGARASSPALSLSTLCVWRV